MYKKTMHHHHSFAAYCPVSTAPRYRLTHQFHQSFRPLGGQKRLVYFLARSVVRSLRRCSGQTRAQTGRPIALTANMDCTLLQSSLLLARFIGGQYHVNDDTSMTVHCTKIRSVPIQCSVLVSGCGSSYCRPAVCCLASSCTMPSLNLTQPLLIMRLGRASCSSGVSRRPESSCPGSRCSVRRPSCCRCRRAASGGRRRSAGRGTPAPTT